MSDERFQTITQLLNGLQAGQAGAADQLIPLVYKELRAIAGRQFRGERRDHTLEPTALVHESFVKLVGQEKGEWTNRAQFFSVAARIMRRILVDHARTRAAQRRGGQWQRITLHTPIVAAGSPNVDLIDLDDAFEPAGRPQRTSGAGCRTALLRRAGVPRDCRADGAIAGDRRQRGPVRTGLARPGTGGGPLTHQPACGGRVASDTAGSARRCVKGG